MKRPIDLARLLKSTTWSDRAAERRKRAIVLRSVLKEIDKKDITSVAQDLVPELRQRLKILEAKRTILDVGMGDMLTPYAVKRRRPGTLMIGIDPHISPAERETKDFIPLRKDIYSKELRPFVRADEIYVDNWPHPPASLENNEHARQYYKEKREQQDRDIERGSHWAFLSRAVGSEKHTRFIVTKDMLQLLKPGGRLVINTDSYTPGTVGDIDIPYRMIKNDFDGKGYRVRLYKNGYKGHGAPSIVVERVKK